MGKAKMEKLWTTAGLLHAVNQERGGTDGASSSLYMKQGSPNRLIAYALFALFAATGTLAACTPKATAPAIEAKGESLFQKKNITDFDLVGTHKIALTFDDGPTAGVTEPLLDLLARKRIKATFFVLGVHARLQPATLERIRREGHLIGNHSYDHALLSKGVYSEKPRLLVDEILSTHNLIKDYFAPGQRLYFRAPYGGWKPEHALVLNSLPEIRDYIGPVFWSVGGTITPAGPRPYTTQAIQTAADWDCWSANAQTGKRALNPDVCAAGYYKDLLAKNGGVVLMHDRDPRTVTMLSYLLAWLDDKGFEFVTLDDLRSMDKYETR